MDFAGYFDSWRTWWLGDLMGVLVIAPLLLTWRQLLHIDRRPWQFAEAIGSLVLLAALTTFVFVGQSPAGGRHVSAVFPAVALPRVDRVSL